MQDVTSRFADLDAATLYYLTAGGGDSVVLLHGIPQTSHGWRYVIPRLAERYRVIAPDLRGLGGSSHPPRSYGKKTVANDVWQLLHDHLGIDRSFLAGHDWGGPVAFSLAVQHPETVQRLSILDVVIPGDGADFSQGGRRWHHAFFRTLDLPEAVCRGREELILGWLFENCGRRPNSITQEDRREYFRTYAKFGAFRARLECYRALPADAEDNKAILTRNGKLRMPVLALGGDKSFGRGMECLQSLQRIAEDVRGGVLPDCGHWLVEEQPTVLAHELMAFFGEGEVARSGGASSA